MKLLTKRAEAREACLSRHLWCFQKAMHDKRYNHVTEGKELKTRKKHTYLHFLFANPGSFAKANGERRRKCTTPETTLLTSTTDDGIQSHTWTSPDIARANALRTVDLVR